MTNGLNIKKLEDDLWTSADLLRSGSALTSNQYCMPVLGLIFLRYAYSRFKMVEAELLKSRPTRNGRPLPIEASDFAEKSALFLPKDAQYSYLVSLPRISPLKHAQHRGACHEQFGRGRQQRDGAHRAAERTTRRRTAQGLHHLLRCAVGGASAHLQQQRAR